MNTIKTILARREWIGEVKKNKCAVAAIMAYAAMYVPGHVKREIKIKAAASGVSYFDVLCCNLACEIAMISCSLNEGVNSEFWKSLAGINATRVGCTSFGIYEKIDGIWAGCRIAPGVMHARNPDWPDPEGLVANASIDRLHFSLIIPCLLPLFEHLTW